jgi:hypothetical protein
MKRYDKTAGEARQHVGPINYYREYSTPEGTTCVGTCEECGNTVLHRPAPGGRIQAHLRPATNLLGSPTPVFCTRPSLGP